ncbi:MAG: PDZ domain-containing protein [Bacteroidales bacterium]|nr:S41 family peptidase [Bacteroidales bacterium]MCR5554377.1 PDZ domain-containing protein [Bacteroidales bacterium]
MTTKKKRNIIIISCVSIIFLTIVGFVRNDFEIAKNLDIYSSLLRQLDEHYVDEINVNDLVKTSIDGMLDKLDPYTVYYPESDLEEFKLMTTGQYGGIGSTIQQDSNYVIFSEPYEGSPAYSAGIQPGDKIISIEGKSMKGASVSDVSNLLKGQPGTKVKITIQPYGSNKTISKEIVREEIKFPNISYSGMIDNQIGYVKLDQFTENAANDVKTAFTQLKNNGMKKFVLDLRDNGGGLLNEAIDIVNLFIDKGNIIVTTKGKNPKQTQTFATSKTALDNQIPIVVLVNRNSASASEIVSGSLQDFDRAVLIGERTFGKGLVQNILPLSYNTRVKVTVSKYYIPSGRCIQGIDYSDKDENGISKHKADSSATAFKTKNGRTVYDYGGVEPDINVEIEPYSTVLLAMFAQQIIFNYANEYKLKHHSIAPAKEFRITDEIYQDFTKFVKTKNLAYETFTEKQIKNLKTSVENDKFSDKINKQISDLEQSVKEEKANDLVRYRKEISQLLQMEIVERYYAQKGRIENSLSIDPDLNKAIEILNNDKTYHSILKGTYNK